MSVFYCNECSKEYNNIDKRPLSLPCGDVFCEKCILRLYNKLSNKIICPNDKKEISIELSKIPICAQILSNLPNSNTTIKEYTKEQKDMNLYCVRHPNKKLKFYCEIDHLFLCSVCLNQHLDHKYIDFKYNKEHFFQEINVIKKNYEETKNKYLLNKKIKEKFVEITKKHFDEQIKKINNYFDMLISSLHEQKSKFISKIMTITSEYNKKYDKFKHIFAIADEKYALINKKLFYINNDLLSKGEYETFYNMKNALITDINNFAIYNDNNINNNEFNKCRLQNYICPKNPFGSDEKIFGTFEDLLIDVNINNINNANQNIINNYNKENSIDNNNHKICVSNITSNKNNISKNFSGNNYNINNSNNNVNHNTCNSINDTKQSNNNLDNLISINLNPTNISNILDSSLLGKQNNNSNNNDSFTDKQFVETGSTFFLLNKNDVKNVFKQQECDQSQNEPSNYDNNNNNYNNINSQNFFNSKNNKPNNYKPYKLINNNIMSNNYFKKNREEITHQKINKIRDNNTVNSINSINNSCRNPKNDRKDLHYEKDTPISLLANLKNSEKQLSKNEIVNSPNNYNENKPTHSKINNNNIKKNPIGNSFRPRGVSYKKMSRREHIINNNDIHHQTGNSISKKKANYDMKDSYNSMSAGNYNNSLVNNNLMISYKNGSEEKYNNIAFKKGISKNGFYEMNSMILTEGNDSNKLFLNNKNKNLVRQRYVNEHFYSPEKEEQKIKITKQKNVQNKNNKKIRQNRNQNVPNLGNIYYNNKNIGNINQGGLVNDNNQKRRRSIKQKAIGTNNSVEIIN